NILLLSTVEQEFKRAGRTQFDVEIFGAIQKAIEQIAAFLERKISHAAFAGIARGDNDRRFLATATGQDRHLLFDFVENIDKAIESKLEQIGRFFHLAGQIQLGERSDHADQLRA